MCEYLMREKITKSGLSGEFAVVSRSLSENYEPQNSPANEQGQLVSRMLNVKHIKFGAYFLPIL